MTDNRTTETATSNIIATLRERGVQFVTYGNTDRVWWTTENGVTWYAQDRPNANDLFVKLEAVLTPEQAIAATLNAVLGDDGYRQAAEYWKGMYEELLTERIGEEERDYPEHDGRYECPDCGNVVYYDELYGGGWTIYVEDYQIPFNNCPNCGKAVGR